MIETYNSFILSQEIDIIVCQNYSKPYIYKIWYNNLGFKQIIFSKNDDIPKEPENSGLLSLLFEFYNFSFLLDIINNIIYTSDQNSHQCMAVQYRCHVIQTETYLLLKSINERLNKSLMRCDT